MEIGGGMTRRTTVASLLGLWLLVGWSPPASAQSILIIQDNNPWGYAYWWDTLAVMGMTASQVDSSQIPTVSLGAYDLVIVPSQQPTEFNALMNANVTRFEDYLDRGGRLILMLATYTSYDPITDLPYGAINTCNEFTTSEYVYNVNPTHPVMLGVPKSLTSNAGSSGELSTYGNGVELTRNVAGATSSYFLDGQAGAAYVSSLTIEWANSVQMQTIGPDAIDHLLHGVCDDLDGDGHDDLACGGDDCDDADAASNPGVAEATCDGIDNDCDPTTADAPDEDEDGWSVCDDCDDTDGTIFPNGVEVPCDYVDNDCDGALHTDETDHDSDGFDVCSDDCNENNAAVHPGADEICDDFLDNDCDGVVDEDCHDGDDDDSSVEANPPEDDDSDDEGGCECHLERGSPGVLAPLLLLFAFLIRRHP